MLKQTPDSPKGWNAKKRKTQGSEQEPKDSPPTLADLAIDKKLSFRSQAIAEVALEVIIDHIQKATAQIQVNFAALSVPMHLDLNLAILSRPPP
jgi:hypothetical protein